MRIGISTRYQHHEATYAALRLADLVKQLGHDVKLECGHQQPTKLGSAWDAQVEANTDFSTWLQSTDFVLWTHVPYRHELTYAKEQGKVTLILPMWRELLPTHRKVLQQAHSVICPHSACLQLVQRWSSVMSNLVLWDCGTPITQRRGLLTEGKISVLVAVFDQSLESLTSELLDQFVRILGVMPNVSFTLAYSSSQARPASLRRLRGLHKRFGERFAVARGVGYRDRAMLYAKHDLTVWPAMSTDIGIVGLNSLAMGTPAVCWRVAPMAEVVPEVAGFRMPCDLLSSTLGATTADPDFCRFGLELQLLLSDPGRILLLQQSASSQAAERRRRFVDFWSKLLEDE